MGSLLATEQKATKITKSIKIYDLVPVRTELLKSFPFANLESRAVTATVLSFADYKYEAIFMLIKLSHRARAYIKNADDLKGFLVEGNIIRILKEARLRGKILNAYRW